MPDQFDIHDHRHELKQLRDSGDTKLFENRQDVTCPVCGGIFEKLFYTEAAGTQFPENDGSRFCVLRESNATLMFRH